MSYLIQKFLKISLTASTLSFYCFQAKVENYKIKYLSFGELGQKSWRFFLGPYIEGICRQNIKSYLIIPLKSLKNHHEVCKFTCLELELVSCFPRLKIIKYIHFTTMNQKMFDRCLYFTLYLIDICLLGSRYKKDFKGNSVN